MKSPFEIRAAGQSGIAEILIYGDIGESWSDESVQAADFVRDLQQIQAQTLNVRINSFGGAASDGVAIYNGLRRHSASVNVFIDGVAVSIASVIAMAGDKIFMAENALMMIHAPWNVSIGNAKDHRISADILDKYADAILSSYIREGGPDTDTIDGWLKDGDDHWLTAQDALEHGLVNEITAPLDVAASLPPKKRFTIPENLMNKKVDPTPDNVVEIQDKARQAQLTELKVRNDSLMQIFGMHQGNTAVMGIKDQILSDPSITLDKAREMILDKMGEGASAVNHPGHQIAGGVNAHHEDFKQAAVDAMLMRNGVQVADPHPAAQDLRGRSILDVAEMMVSNAGRTFLGGAGPLEIVRAAMTTSDFPELLSGIASRSLMIGYQGEPASYRQWVREVEVRDFKEVKRVAISSAPPLLHLPEHAAYQEGSLSEKAEPYSLDTWGRQMILTRQAMVNDDLGGFARLPQAFGASAARKETDMVYQLLIDNPVMSDGNALFSAQHANDISPAALSVTSLSAARKAMRRQKDVSGEGYLNIVPRYLIVPTALESEAMLLVANEHFERTISGDTTRAGLEWIKALEIVVDPRLDDDSETAWYMAGHTSQCDTIESAHLEGERVFTEESKDWDTDAYKIKARIDYMAAVIDWVGLIRNEGA